MTYDRDGMGMGMENIKKKGEEEEGTKREHKDYTV
jgi:hypothetical protein